MTRLAHLRRIRDAIDKAIAQLEADPVASKLDEEEEEDCSPSACDGWDYTMPQWWMFRCWLKRCPPMEP